jgi:hypothetical protein
MIADELKVLFDDLKNDIMLLRTDMTLLNHDIALMRAQLDNIEQGIHSAGQEPIGIAPGTPPPTMSIPPSPYEI